MKDSAGSSEDVNTIQGVDYTSTCNALDYGKTWVVRDAILGATEPDGKINHAARSKPLCSLALDPMQEPPVSQAQLEKGRAVQ